MDTIVEHTTTFFTTVMPILALGFLLTWLTWVGAGRAARRALPPEMAALLQRACAAVVGGLTLAQALDGMGVDLTVLLGAASILTVAAGFAAQTSASNFISGLFLIAERPFGVGDVIEVGGYTGEVKAIDLMSTKLRTFDNRYVRFPNETVMKTEIVNLTRYPIRRIDVPLVVGMSADGDAVSALLIETAAANPRVLDEPAPAVFFEGFSDLGMQLRLVGWASRASFADVRRELGFAVKRGADRGGRAAVHPPHPAPVAAARGSRGAGGLRENRRKTPCWGAWRRAAGLLGVADEARLPIGALRSTPDRTPGWSAVDERPRTFADRGGSSSGLLSDASANRRAARDPGAAALCRAGGVE